MRIRHLRDKLALASLVLIVPFIIWNVISQSLRFSQARRTAASNEQEMARDVSTVFIDFVEDVVSLEHTAALVLWGESRIPRQAVPEYLTEADHSTSKIVHIAAAGPGGVIFASDTEQLVNHNASRHPSVLRIMHGASWSVSNVFRSRIAEEPMFVISTGIRDDAGRLLGIVIALVDEQHLRGILKDGIAIGVMGREQIVITDSEGMVVLTQGGSPLSLKQRDWRNLPFIRRALAGRTAFVDRFRMPNGEVVTGSTVPISEAGWTASVFVPREMLMGPIRRQAILRTLIVVMIVGLVVGMAFYLGNCFARPVLNLAGAACAFGEGNLQARADVHTGDEIEYLSASFNNMADSLQERTNQLNEAVESRKQQAERASALYAVAQGLVVTTGLDERLEVIAHALAAICHMKRVAVFLSRGGRIVGAAGWNLVYPDKFTNLSFDIGSSNEFLVKSVAESHPLIVKDISTDSRINPRFHKMLSDLRVKGFIALPLMSGRHLVGVATLDDPGEPPHCEPESIETGRELATLAAIAIENSEAFEKWAKIAQALQSSLLPSAPEKLGSFSFACGYYPAMEMAELGGDFYDFIPLPDGRVGLVIADVSGKGLEAAVFTAMGKYTLRAFLSEEPGPEHALTRTNETLTRTGVEWGFLTMFFGILDTKTGCLYYANAGHPPTLVVHQSGEVAYLPCTDRQPPLGVFGNIDYMQDEFRLFPGDVLVGYTDGVTDARRDDEQFEPERLAEVVTASRHLPPEGILQAIHDAVLDFSQGRLQDDIALIAAKYEQV